MNKLLALALLLILACADKNPVVYRTNTVTDTVKVCPPKDTCKHDCDDDWQARMIVKYTLPEGMRQAFPKIMPIFISILGDVNGDGFVDVMDAGYLLEYVQSGKDIIVHGNSDVNCDGVVDWADFWSLISYFETVEGDICPSDTAFQCLP